MQSEKNAAIFLDRDGTIIEDRGYLKDPAEVAFFPGVFSALRRAAESFTLFIVTNQSGISKGLTAPEEVDLVNNYVLDRLADEGVRIAALYSCPHDTEDACACKKPGIFFAEEAAKDFGISLKKSWAVGDHPHDVVFAENFGGRGVYVLTGHGERHAAELSPRALVRPTLCEALKYIEDDNSGR